MESSQTVRQIRCTTGPGPSVKERQSQALLWLSGSRVCAVPESLFFMATPVLQLGVTPSPPSHCSGQFWPLFAFPLGHTEQGYDGLHSVDCGREDYNTVEDMAMLTTKQYSTQYTLATTALGTLAHVNLVLLQSPRALILYRSGYRGKH